MAHLTALQLIHGYGVITTALVTVEKTMTSQRHLAMIVSLGASAIHFI
jgi:hypothetical protein